jgi:hypothetical protein
MTAADPADAHAAGTGRLPTARVRIHLLRGCDSPRLAGEDAQHVRTLAGVEGGLPPIIVHRQSMRVVDGMHRLRAAVLRGETDVEARFVDGDAASCFVLAVEANVRHGLPLSLEDRKAAAARILGLYPEWSDRRVASVAGLAAKTVASLRPYPTDDVHQLDTVRIGRDGRARPVDAAERREMAIKLLGENPTASLRAIARDAGVSPETVRGLRTRLRGTQNPAGASDDRTGQARPVGSVARAHAPGRRAAIASAEDPTGRSGGPALSILMADPALRSTEIGRALLRALSGSVAIAPYCQRIPAIVPGYSLPLVAEAARDCGQVWLHLADYLEKCGEHGTEKTSSRIINPSIVRGA